jgi:hypothetical protein
MQINNNNLVDKLDGLGYQFAEKQLTDDTLWVQYCYSLAFVQLGYLHLLILWMIIRYIILYLSSIYAFMDILSLGILCDVPEIRIG